MADFTDFAPSLLGRILWEPNCVGAEICGRQNSDFLEGLQFFISDLGNFVGRRDTYESLIFA